MKTLREYIDLISEDSGITTTQLTPAQYQAKMDQVNAARVAQGQTALPVTPSDQIATPTAAQATPVTTPAPAAQPAAQPAATRWQAGVLGMGSSGPEVEALQKRLGVAVDGKFGTATQQAVIALQQKLGVTPDGAYGPITKAAHDKNQGARPLPPPTNTNVADKGQPGHTVANDTKPNATTDTTQANRTLTGIQAGRIDPDSARGRTTMAIPTNPLPAGNPSGVGKNASYSADEVAAAKDLLKDPNAGATDKAWAQGIVSRAGTTPPAQTAPAQTPTAVAPVQTAPAQTPTAVAPAQTAPAQTAPAQTAPANNVGPRPAIGSPASKQWAAKYAKTHDPATGNPLEESIGYNELQRIVSLVHYR